MLNLTDPLPVSYSHPGICAGLHTPLFRCFHANLAKSQENIIVAIQSEDILFTQGAHMFVCGTFTLIMQKGLLHTLYFWKY